MEFRRNMLAGSIALGSAVALYLSEVTFEPYIAAYSVVKREGSHHPYVFGGAIAFYLAMLAILPRIMKNRGPVQGLTPLIVLHNWLLSTFSLTTTIGILKEIALYALRGSTTFVDVLCDPNYDQSSSTKLYFWYHLFYLSKMYEFIDTIILILRKKPVIFLHTWHHITTLSLCWICLDSEFGLQWLSSAANTIIHTMMYYYYACIPLGISVWWKKYLTTFQITQFVIDITINTSWAYYTAYTDTPCSGNWFTFWYSHFVLFSFLLLFIQFFRKNYSGKPADAQKRASAKSD